MRHPDRIETWLIPLSAGLVPYAPAYADATAENRHAEDNASLRLPCRFRGPPSRTPDEVVLESLTVPRSSSGPCLASSLERHMLVPAAMREPQRTRFARLRASKMALPHLIIDYAKAGKARCARAPAIGLRGCGPGGSIAQPEAEAGSNRRKSPRNSSRKW